MKIRPTLLTLGALSLGAVGFRWYNTRVETVLASSPSLILYSLNPNAMARNYSERIVDKVIISDQVGKDELLAATNQALHWSRASLSSCFNPRHGVSTSDGATVLDICFECGQVQIETGEDTHMVPVKREAASLFDALVRKYHLKTVE